jgi:hypothetical protein
MDNTKYSCTSNKYIINDVQINISPVVRIISLLFMNNSHIQIVIRNANTIISFTSADKTVDMIRTLHAFLLFKKYNIPPELIPFGTITTQFTAFDTYSVEHLVVSTLLHNFRVYIKQEQYYYYIYVGGKEFQKCVEIFINKENGKLCQIYSEPECWSNLGKKGNTVDMIKGALQVCNTLFGTTNFVFDDMSTIECGMSNKDGKPPRKLTSPFSLAHLYLAQRGKTWYEYNFNARISNSEKRVEYEKAIQRLYDPVAKSELMFDTFLRSVHINTMQSNYLKPFYESCSTWNEFFNAIPKSKICFAFFKWLPDFIDRHILRFKPLHHEWEICFDCDNEMERTSILFETEQVKYDLFRGLRRNKTRKNSTKPTTRKNKYVVLSMSNSFY